MKAIVNNCNDCPFFNYGVDEHGPTCNYPIYEDAYWIDEWDFPNQTDNETLPERCGLRIDKVEVELTKLRVIEPIK